MQVKRTIYLDVCCLNRPFDDQLQDRIHMEAEAIMLVLKRCDDGQWQWIGSSVVNYEISKTTDFHLKDKLKALAAFANQVIKLNKSIVSRAREIMEMGFNKYDAL